MNKLSDQVKGDLKNLSEKFPQITIKYDFDELINYHIVEITPVFEYYNNVALDNSWIDLSLKYKKLFNTEDITFISSDSYLRIKNPKFILNGTGKI